MALVTAEGVRLMVDDRGGGEPLVLIHGSWDDRRTWGLVQDELARSFRAVSYDRRGHTDSEAGPSPGSRREDEDDLAALVESLASGPAHLVANSFGSSIALGLAARRPELVRSLCAHEPPLMALAADDPVVRQAAEAVGEVVSLIDRGDDEAAARSFVDRVAFEPGAWDAMPAEDREMMIVNAGTFADEQRDPAWADADLDALGALDRPVLLTFGSESPPFFPAIISVLDEAMDCAAVRQIPSAGHVPHMTHPDAWAAVVLEFAGGAS